MCFRFLFSCNDFSHAIGFMSWWMDYIKNRSAVQRYNTSQEQKHYFWGEEKAQGQMILKRKQNRSGIHKPIFFFLFSVIFPELKASERCGKSEYTMNRFRRKPNISLRTSSSERQSQFISVQTWYTLQAIYIFKCWYYQH